MEWPDVSFRNQSCGVAPGQVYQVYATAEDTWRPPNRMGWVDMRLLNTTLVEAAPVCGDANLAGAELEVGGTWTGGGRAAGPLGAPRLTGRARLYCAGVLGARFRQSAWAGYARCPNTG